jgi:hypothetical protein
MNAPEFRSTALGDLLRIYAAAVHGEATEDGDYRTGNKEHDKLTAVCRELRTRGLKEQRALLGSLDHPDDAVRGWAAAHALEFAPEEGEPVLESHAAGESLASFAAEITLEEWKKGSLKFP